MGDVEAALECLPPDVLDRNLCNLVVTTVVISGCNYANCPRATVYGASERDYRVLVVADAISGVIPQHLEEAGRMGVVYATTEQTVERVAALAAAQSSRGRG